MTTKEFLEKNPNIFNKLKACKNKEDFTKTAEQNGIKFGAGKLDEIYSYVKGISGDNEISDEALSSASGGGTVTPVNFGARENYIIT